MRNEVAGGGFPETVEAIEAIRKGQRAGRQVVPLLGAGISVESGYPPTRSIIDYLAAVKYYFDQKLHLPQPQLREEEQSKDLGGYDWYTHLSLFGWPDRFELTEQLWNHFKTWDPGGENAKTPIRRRLWLAIKDVLRHEWSERNDDTPERLLKLRNFLLEHKDQVEGWIKAAPASGESKASAEIADRMLRDPRRPRSTSVGGTSCGR